MAEKICDNCVDLGDGSFNCIGTDRSECGRHTPEPQAVSGIPDDTWTVAVSRWINEHVRNTPIAASVEAWNHLGSVLPKLKEFLAQELTKSGL